MAHNRRLVTSSGLVRAFIDLSLAALYVWFAYAHVIQFRTTHRPSLVLVVGMETLFAAFLIIRRPAEEWSRSKWDWCVTVGGTVASLLFRPSPAGMDLPLAQVLQVLGTGACVMGVVFLNRSVGLVPAYRGVRSRGAYALVRHPLYSGYTIANAGYLLNNWTAYNVVIFIAGLGFQIARIFAEERLLSRYGEYRAYQARTRWRLLPFVF